MLPTTSECPCKVYLFECPGNVRYVIFNASVFNNPYDFCPDQWYAWPYPVGEGFMPGEAFDSAADAERSVRAKHPSST